MIPKSLSAFYARLPISEKFKQDAVWNMGSTAFCGLTGLAVVLIISKCYGPEILGLFSLTQAFYVIVSQFSVLGIHFSILKHVAQFASDELETRIIMTTGFGLAFLTSLFFIALAFILKNSFSALFNKPKLGVALVQVLPALLFFSFNKICFAYLNARRLMKSYSIFQAFRYFFLLISLVVLLAFSFDGEKIPIIFSIAETCLFMMMLIFLYGTHQFRLDPNHLKISWLQKHFLYGFKSTFGNIFAETNSKIDVFILGFFSTSKIVGIYSFPAMLADGFNQISGVLRTNVNPILTAYRYQKEDQALEDLIIRGRNLAYKFLIPAGLLVVLSFPIMIALFSLNKDFYKGMIPFILLMAGCIASVGYRPFLMLPNQTGHPGHQSLLFFLVFLTNLIGNLILIPIFEMNGAAIGTSLAFVSTVFYLKWILRKTQQLNI